MSKYTHDHDCPFAAYITNLGKYNEGDLVGEWVKFPTSPDTEGMSDLSKAECIQIKDTLLL